MPINKDNMDFLFDTLSYYSNEYNDVADSCFNDVTKALNEICKQYLVKQNVSVLPYGSYAIKSNYQVLEPMEFYLVLPADKNAVLAKEYQQQQELRKHKKKHRSIKSIYHNILADSGNQEQVSTAGEVASIVMQELQKYLTPSDSVYFKNNVVFIKFSNSKDVQISAIVYVVYNFENNGNVEFKKHGYNRVENPTKLMQNLEGKNQQTNGNYLLMCQVIKMLELELVLNGELSSVYLSDKSLFIENILYNVPNTFFQGDDYLKMFVDIVNFVKQCTENDLIYPDGNNEKMFKKIGYYDTKMLKSLIKKLVFLYYNTDSLIQKAIDEAEAEEEQTNENDNQDGDKIDETNTPTEIKKLGK